MWRKLQEFPPYFILTTHNNGFEVYVTDYVAIWFNDYTHESFLSCLQDSNFGLEINRNELIEKGTNLLLHPDELKNLNISKNASTLVVSMTKMFEFPLKIKLKLVEGTREMFFQKISHILLKTISDLKSSQQELRDLLKKKDDEIDEYKCEGKEIALRYLKTERFNDENHMKQHHVDKENGQLLDISGSLLEKVASTANETEIIKQENMKNLQIKQEPQTPIDSQSALCLTSNSVKKELKLESQMNTVSSRKKKKMLNY